MLLTLTARSLASRLNARGARALLVSDLPRFVFQQTTLRGLALDTALFKGWGLDDLETLRVQADQAGCPCLLLRESYAVSSGQSSGAGFEKAMQRVQLVARAAHRLGCNALSLQPDCAGKEANDRTFDHHVGFYRHVVERVDRLELNVLVEPATGWLGEPNWLIELVKKVGGFRIGTLPTFEAACRTPDCVAALRQTAPYAGAVLGSFGDNDVPEVPAESELPQADEPPADKPAKKMMKKKKTAGKSPSRSATATATRTSKKTTRRPKVKAESAAPSRFVECVAALRAVGYEQILALDYLGSRDSVAAINAARARIEALLGAT